MYVNGYDHPNILSGAGTMGLEIIEQVPDVEAVVIPVGGGGLIAGCAVALKTMKPNIKIIVSFKIHLVKYVSVCNKNTLISGSVGGAGE